jgi:ubiquinone/menaquinone biosynthesis C-methylase UbiE
MNTLPHPHSAPPDFNRLAHIYRWMELSSFGPWLQRCRCTFLDSLSGCRRALVIGDGDGRFTACLLRANSHIQVDAIDASSAMLHELIHRAGSNADRVRTVLTDARTWQPANSSYDLIVTHFFLDCLTAAEIQSLAQTVRHASAPSVRWLVSEFAIPSGWYGRLFARPLIRCLYFAFGLLTGLRVRALPEHRAKLQQSGFEMIAEHKWLAGLLVSEIWTMQLLQSC